MGYLFLYRSAFVFFSACVFRSVYMGHLAVSIVCFWLHFRFVVGLVCGFCEWDGAVVCCARGGRKSGGEGKRGVGIYLGGGREGRDGI